MDYFIDESGQTGDLAKSNAISGFGAQPIFSLAAIGVTDSLSLQREIDQLKMKYRIRLTELKSSMLSDRPEFTLDVVRFISGERYPLFLEIMDKKYFLAAHITSCQLLPPISGFSEDIGIHFVKNAIADYIFERAPDEVFTTLIEACKSPSDLTLCTQLETLIDFARSAPSEEEPAIAICELATATRNEYFETRAEGREKSFLKYLPTPDDNKFNKPVWILPNLSAFTNIYARINRYEKGSLSSVRLIHDEQLQFDSILKTSKSAAESLQHAATEVFTPHSDYHFREAACLSFQSSSTSMGLQIADVLAGFCMRYMKDSFSDEKEISPLAHQAYDLLRRCTDPKNGTGVNLVTSNLRARALSLFAV